MFHGTTVICVKKENSIAMMSDGQVTFGNTILKNTAKKVRQLDEFPILAGFAGSTADAISLLEKYKDYLKQCSGDEKRAAVMLAKDWASDKILRKLEALLLIASKENLYLISGSGDVIVPDEPVAAIGSGGDYAKSAALALLKHAPHLSAREIAEESLQIAAHICLYTNSHFSCEELTYDAT